MKSSKVKIIVCAAAICIVVGIIGVTVVIAGKNSDKSDTVSKETEVKYGNITVGVTESGSAEIGSISQAFELELNTSSSVSSLSGTSSSGSKSSGSSTSGGSSSSVSTSDGSSTSGGSSSSANKSAGNSSGGNQSGVGSSSSNSSGKSTETSSGGSNSTAQSSSNSSSSVSSSSKTGTSTSSSNSSTSETAKLTVEDVYVTTGQVISKGDALLKITDESIVDSRKILQRNVETANINLEKAKISRQEAQVDADYTYKSNSVLGSTANEEYNAAISSLEKNVTDAQNAVSQADNKIAELTDSLESNTEKLNSLNSQLESATDPNTISSLKSQIEKTQSTISSNKSSLDETNNNYSSLTSQLASAQRKLTTGSITAKKQYEESMLSYKNASTLYDIDTNGINDDVVEAQEALEEAQSTLDKFEQYIGDGVIYSDYEGTVTSVGYKKDDSLSTDTDIITIADPNAVTMTVSVSQEDISAVNVGDAVNIVLTAYEDELYNGTVSGIETTTTSGSSTVSYNVTVNLAGDVSKIYSGMTGNVTFITKEIKDVTYVSNKAITVDGTKSYVKLKNSDGSYKQTEVTTGFSDGINVEIQSGLEEGDTVIIESQVTKK